MKVTNINVFNFEGAIRGMRNPLESYKLSDSKYNESMEYVIGNADLDLMKKLTKAGKDHRKFLRQILVSFDVNAPEYWWKQYHTYKVATVENSTSQMHTLGKRLLTRNDFEIEDNFPSFDIMLSEINNLISEWQKTKDKNIWRKIIQIIPQSFLYTKTCTLSYETIVAICLARENHKLKEWNIFIEQILSGCPYLKEILSVC